MAEAQPAGQASCLKGSGRLGEGVEVIWVGDLLFQVARWMPATVFWFFEAVRIGERKKPRRLAIQLQLASPWLLQPSQDWNQMGKRYPFALCQLLAQGKVAVLTRTKKLV